MRKAILIVFLVLWLLTVPFALFALGFAGDKFFSLSATAGEIAKGEFQVVLTRLAFLIYIIGPPVLFLSMIRPKNFS